MNNNIKNLYNFLNNKYSAMLLLIFILFYKNGFSSIFNGLPFSNKYETILFLIVFPIIILFNPKIFLDKKFRNIILVLFISSIFYFKYFYSKNIVKKEKFIMSSFDSIFESNEDTHRRFNDNYFYVKNFHTQLKKVLSDNIAFIKKYLNSGFIMVMKKNDSLHIVSTRNNKLEIFLEKATYEMYPKTYFLDESVIKSIKNEINICFKK